MKLSLNKKALKNLSKDAEIIPADQTPEIGGGLTQQADCMGSVIETNCYCNSNATDCNTGLNPSSPCVPQTQGCVSRVCITEIGRLCNIN